MTHAEHAGLNGRGYRLRGCMECELRYRMAYPNPDPPDSAVENAAWIAAAVTLLLFIYAISGAPMAWPVR